MIRRAPKAERTDANGIVFDSKSEMQRWHELQLLQRAGQIKNLRRQVKFPLVINGTPILIRSQGYPNGRACSYSADFVYQTEGGSKEIIEDWKGLQTEASRLRIAVAEAIHGFRVLLSGPAVMRRKAR